MGTHRLDKPAARTTQVFVFFTPLYTFRYPRKCFVSYLTELRENPDCRHVSCVSRNRNAG